MFNLILVSVLLIQACHCLEGGRTDVRTILGDPQSDAYIDQILENLRQMIQDQGLDPMDLPDLETGFSDTILGITWHGSAKVITARSPLPLSLSDLSQLNNGQFWGLASIARTGDTSFTVADNVTELTAMLGLNGPKAHYDARAEFMGIGVGGGVEGGQTRVDHILLISSLILRFFPCISNLQCLKKQKYPDFTGLSCVVMALTLAPA